MPDVLSIGVGGGSLVKEADNHCKVGPQSTGYRLQKESLVFGGNTLTATDIAVRAGQADVGDKNKVTHLSQATVDAALNDLHAQIEEAIDQIKVNAEPLPLILVGGGSILVARKLKGISEVLKPAHAEVANAVGAAIALVSGRVDKLYDVAALGRDKAVAEAKAEAVEAAVTAGAAKENVEIVELSELPMTHMRAGAVQIKVRAVGPLAVLS